MPYEAGFYVIANIVGFTGDMYGLPTVYFEDQHHRGRITQSHEDKDNEGRSMKKSKIGYAKANVQYGVGANMSLHMVESMNARTVHTSRNAFLSSEHLGPEQIAILARAITNFPELKPRDQPGYVPQPRDDKCVIS